MCQGNDYFRGQWIKEQEDKTFFNWCWNLHSLNLEENQIRKSSESDNDYKSAAVWWTVRF